MQDSTDFGHHDTSFSYIFEFSFVGCGHFSIFLKYVTHNCLLVNPYENKVYYSKGKNRDPSVKLAH